MQLEMNHSPVNRSNEKNLMSIQFNAFTLKHKRGRFLQLAKIRFLSVVAVVIIVGEEMRLGRGRTTEMMGEVSCKEMGEARRRSLCEDPNSLLGQQDRFILEVRAGVKLRRVL